MSKPQEIINDRMPHYGSPVICFTRTARLQDVVAECQDPVARVILNNIAQKMARLINNPAHQDSWADIQGYGLLGEQHCVK